MRYLIVNGDDFGINQGITRGILEAHRFGILTSTSMMVNMPCSSEAAQLSREYPTLSIGLHVNLTTEDGDPVIDFDATAQCRDELQRQRQMFQELLHRLPSHLDSHHNVHRDPRLLPQFLDLAQRHALPLREHSPVRYLSKFYGQWDGEVHLEQIGVEGLLEILESELGDGVTELSCHPGYIDPGFRSGYSRERETELQTLCDPRIRARLAERGIALVGFQDLSREQSGLSREARTL